MLARNTEGVITVRRVLNVLRRKPSVAAIYFGLIGLGQKLVPVSLFDKGGCVRLSPLVQRFVAQHYMYPSHLV
jgi:hypothetical protein